MKVYLRKKLSADGKRHVLYLDWSIPVQNPATGKMTRRKFLKLELIADPRTPQDRQTNRITTDIASERLAEAQLKINAGDFSFLGDSRSGLKILDHMRSMQKKAKTDGTVMAWQNAINRLAEFAGEDTLIASIDRTFLEKYKAHLLARLSINTACVRFSMLRTALRDAYRNELIDKNINDFVKPIQSEKTIREHLEKDEIERLKGTPHTDKVSYRAAMWAIYTGMRFSDVETLRLRDLRKDKGGYTYPFKPKKTSAKVLYLPVSAKAAESILWDKDGAELQFPLLKKIIYREDGAFRKWVDSSGINKRITFHTFRHTFATRLIEEGADLYLISALLGHTSINTTQIYAQIGSKAMRSAVELL